MSHKKTLIEEVLENIRADRNQAQYLLTQLLAYIGKNDSQIKDAGFVASKYLETLQKSNEELVKVVEIVRKNKNSEDEDLTAVDKEELYDQLEEENK
jgi:hypothetical protein